jgi:hypothetical protein
LVKLGTSLTAVTEMVNVCDALVSTPPFAVPPLSCSRTVTVAEPFAFAAGVYVNFPFESIAGSAEKRGSLFVVTRNVTVCPFSSAGPGLIAVAHPVTDCAPESSSTVSSDPLVKLGGSLTAVTLIRAVSVAML